MKIILASKSPRRKELLESLGIRFTICTDDSVDEGQLLADQSVALVDRLERLAILKGCNVANQNPSAVVISADTVVALDDRVLGKPANLAESQEMLALLSGRTHRVFTAVCIQRNQDELTKSRVDHTEVTFRSLKRNTIERYVERVQTLDKAGAYAIQELGALLIEGIRGDYTTVVGLPLGPTCELLNHFGVEVI